MFLSRRHSPLTRKDQGLTLVEIMVALTITALVVSIVYGSLRAAGDSLRSLSARNELYRTTYAVLEEMGRELASTYVTWNGRAQNVRGATYFYVEGREVNGMPQDDLFFTTYGHAFSPTSAGESDQSEICYTARYSEKREELVLLKKEDWSLDGTTCRDETFDWDEPYEHAPYVVATGIHPEKGVGYRLVGFQLELFKMPADEESVEKWNSVELGALPSRVKVTLSFKDSRDEVLTFSKEVLLRLGGPIQAAPAAPPSGGGGGQGGPQGQGSKGSHSSGDEDEGTHSDDNLF